jgi:glycosyltransferase involved in cell wall biosynthesis
LLIWLTGFILSGVIYAIGYQQEPRIINLSFTEYLLTAIQFFLNLLAAPLVKIPILSTIIGAIIFVLFMRILVDGFKTYSFNLTSPPTPLYPPCPALKGLGEGSNKIEESLTTLPITKNPDNQFAPWLSIGLFSLLTSLLMTWGRVEFGGNYPLTATRYTTHTLLLIVSLVQLYRILITNSKKIWNFNRENRILIYSFFGGILFSLIAVSSQTAITQAKLELPNKQSSQTCLNLFFRSGVPKHLVSVIPNAVDCDMFHPKFDTDPINRLVKVRLG